MIAAAQFDTNYYDVITYLIREAIVAYILACIAGGSYGEGQHGPHPKYFQCRTNHELIR